MVTLTGAALTIAAVAWVYPPAGLLVAGLLLLGYGLLVMNTDA